VRDLATQGTTIMLSSHLLGEVEQVCDRVTVMLHGRLVAETPPATLSEHRAYRVVLTREDLEPASQSLHGFLVDRIPPDVLIVSASSGREVSLALAAAGIAPEALVPERPSLEAWYLGITSPRKAEEDRHADHATAPR
jgi:ABC-2 type transport system ATP-binding protein